MNQRDLIEHVTAQAGVSKAEAGRAVEAVFGGMTAALASGNEVRLPGFGSIKVVDRPAREGRNPRTGETVKIAAARVAKFSAGKGLKEALNGT